MQTALSRPADRLGRIGVWSRELRYGDRAAAREAAAELEDLGYDAIWIPGGAGGDILDAVDNLAGVTRRAVIATGIVNIWRHEPAEIGAWWRALAPERKARILLGLGVSHGPMIGPDYRHPLAAMSAFLDGLDAEGLPTEHRCLAALGPKMLALSRDRSAGAHPYLVTPEHTALARATLGSGPLLAPEQAVILETDPGKAREIAREALSVYLGFPNYVNQWRRLGFSEADVTGPSDTLCDALFAWGGLDQIKARVEAHLDAGADHVCLQVIGPEPGAPLRAAWRQLAEALL